VHRLRLVGVCQELAIVRQLGIRPRPNAKGSPTVAKEFASLPKATGGISRLAAMRVAQEGIDLGPLLRKANLSPRLIEDRDARISVQSQVAFLNLVAEALRDEFIGFNLAREFDLREIGLLYYVMASSEMLGDALTRAERYSQTVNEGIRVICRKANGFTVEVGYVGVARHQDRHQIEFLITAVLRTCRHLTNRVLAPTRASFVHHRSSAFPEMEHYFGCDISFGSEHDEIVFEGLAARLPVVSSDPYLNQALVKYHEEALSRRSANANPLRIRVENAITPLLPHAAARVGDVARGLGMSPRTLARRLASEGLSFTSILDELRSGLATRYLQDARLSISTIAWLLGYRETSAFTHACQRWTGRTPRAARRHLGNE
jgi:AraC-like DNA-binding protein